MMGTRRHFGLLSSPWLVTGASVLALAVLSVLLWSPWDRPGIAGGSPLRLYCAAGMSKPVAEVISDYQKEYGVRVQVTYDTSGNLLTSIRAQSRTPGDLYLSNDLLTMRDAQHTYGVVAEVIPVATNYPVIVINRRTHEALQKQGDPVTSAHHLLRPDLKVVLASDSASIAKLTRRVLEPLGIWSKLEALRKTTNRVSDAGTVEQVAQKVSLQEGHAGIVWSAVAHQFTGVEIIRPPEFNGVKEQALIGVLTRSDQPTAALQFARYLTARDRGMEVLGRHHFEPVPDSDHWEKSPAVLLSAGAMLKPGVEEAVRSFEQREGVKVNTTFAGCGPLVTQMKALKVGDATGKFPDAYFACDASFLADVQQWFDRPATVSQNDAVLVVHKGNPKGVQPSLHELTRKDLKIGLPHPENSALGKLIDDRLKARGWYNDVYPRDWRDRIIHTDAAHDLIVKMRAAPQALDLVVVYRSNALSTPANVEKYLDVIELGPDGMRATQPFAVAKETRHPYLVRRLLDAITAERSAERFKELGFHWAYEAK